MLKNRYLAFFCGSLVFFHCTVSDSGQSVTPEPSQQVPTAVDVEEYPSVELQLMGVRIGAPYYETKKQLTKKYGKPISRDSYDAFYLDKKTDNALLIATGIVEPHVVETIMVIGTHPVKGLDFFANMQLGDPEEKIPLLFPKAVARPQKVGNCQYHIPKANYFISTKNGVVNFLSLSNLYVTTIRASAQSIGLSEMLLQMASEQGLLAEPVNIDKLNTFLEDPLRPYCESRYPLRQAPNGRSFVDINIFQNEKSKPVPGTFLVDTGWSFTAISPEICRKISCKPLMAATSKPDSAFIERYVTGGMVEIGPQRVNTEAFSTIPPKMREYHKNLDGILGVIPLFISPLFINFKLGYLCFPALPVSQVAQSLHYKKIEAGYTMLAARTDFYVNDQMLKHGILDSGADITTLPKQNISHLKLKDLGVKWPIIGLYGVSPCSSYGPVELGWPSLGITQKLKKITEDPSIEFSLIGIDFLKHYILGPELNAVYLGE